MGVDRAVLVSDPAAAGSDLVGTAKLLAAALGADTPDLALFGQQASDGAGAVLWAAVAELLRQPFVSQASSLAVRDGSVVVSRETEYGNDVIEAPLPALVAVSDAINEPRYTSLKGRMAAKKKPLDVVSVADLGIDAGGVGEAGAKTAVLASGIAAVAWRDRHASTTRPAHRRPSSPSSRSVSSYEGARPPRAPRRARSRRARSGVLAKAVVARRRRRRRRDHRWRARSPSSPRRPGRTVRRQCTPRKATQFDPPLPQPRVDVIEHVVREHGFDTVMFCNSVLCADIAAGLSARLDAGSTGT